MKLHRGMKPGRIGSGSLLASLLWVAMAHANPLHPTEHLGYWIDEGITPPAAAESWAIEAAFLQNDEIPLDESRALSAVAIHGHLPE